MNAEMVKEGAAQVYGKYCRDFALCLLEKGAREVHRALCALPDAAEIAPRECKHHARPHHFPPRRIRTGYRVAWEAAAACL